LRLWEAEVRQVRVQVVVRVWWMLPLFGWRLLLERKETVPLRVGMRVERMGIVRYWAKAPE
jgi:hypothetical protein